MNRDEIVEELFRMQDKDYAALQAKIIPSAAADRIIGVRTPALRAFAKRLSKDNDVKVFLSNLPHQYFDEDQLHAFVISLEKESEKLLPYIQAWIRSDKTYTVRFAIGMLMQHFLDERFDTKYADMVAEVRSEEYYVNMMIAWYFATALAKQYEAVLPYLKEKRLDDWVHNKAIQKSVESYRITDEQKAYLKTLKVQRRRSGERKYTACRSTAKSGSSKKCCCTNRVKNLNI